MKLSAIVCEYNPFHNGHAYLLNKALRISDGAVCLMSGDFVQRAEPAVCDKYFRARCALDNGAGMVIELPVSVSTAPGERFAHGAVRAAGKIPDVKKLIMGCETHAPETLRKLAEIQSNETDDFKFALKERLATGASYAQSYTFATVSEAKKIGIDEAMSDDILRKPNNLLCIEYIKAIRKLGLSIEPVLIKRKGAGYNDTILQEYASASAIRENLSNRDAIKAAMPANCGEAFIQEIADHPLDKKLYEGLTLDALRRSTPETLRSGDAVEGLEYKLCKSASEFTSLADVLNDVKSKRYTMSRLKRICLSALLGPADGRSRLRVLGVKDTFRPYLGALGEDFFVKTSELKAGENIAELRADSIYTLITGIQGNRFYSNRLITVR